MASSEKNFDEYRDFYPSFRIVYTHWGSAKRTKNAGSSECIVYEDEVCHERLKIKVSLRKTKKKIGIHKSTRLGPLLLATVHFISCHEA